MRLVKYLVSLICCIFGILTFTTPVYAYYITGKTFDDSVICVPNITDESLAQTANVYSFEANKNLTTYTPNKEDLIGLVLSAQNKNDKSILNATGQQKQDYVPNATDGLLREMCAIPLGQGDIWFYGDGKKNVLTVDDQKTIVSLLDLFYYQSDTLGHIQKYNQVKQIELAQMSLVELITKKPYQMKANMDKQTRKDIDFIKNIVLKYTHLSAYNRMRVVNVTDSQIEFDRKPNSNEEMFVSINGKQTKLTTNLVELPKNTKNVEITGTIYSYQPYYFKDAPLDVVNEKNIAIKECRDGVAMNYCGMIRVQTQSVTYVDNQLVYSDSEPDSTYLDMVRTSEWTASKIPVAYTILFATMLFMLIVSALVKFGSKKIFSIFSKS